MGKDVGAEGACKSAFWHWLKIIEDQRIGKILGQEFLQFGFAERFEISGQTQPDHIRIIPGHDGQNFLGFLPIEVIPVEQAGNCAVYDINDLRNRHGLQLLAARVPNPFGQCGHLCIAQHRYQDLE